MNSTLPEANEQALVRRSSTSSESSKVSRNDENPLMKLVDAALSPNSALKATTSVEKHNKIETNEEKGEDLEVPHAAAAAAADDGSQAPEADKVLRGTVQDLVARREKVTFAEYLMQCLADEANHDVLQWMPCGLQFTITNHRKFTMERMPALFKIRNMSSFVRKLTRWGFSRVHEKETGNSDIFKHEYFLRDKPELCKKIRCVNRSIASEAKPLVSNHLMTNREMMGNRSEASMHRAPMHPDDFHLMSPRRSMGHGVSFAQGRSPHSSQYTSSPKFYSHHSPGHMAAHVPHRRPHRVSPEYEREMLGQSSAFPSRPGPPQVYSPPSMGRTMSAAAECELEQVLLERQRARIYREQQHLQAIQQQQQHQKEHHNNQEQQTLIPRGSSSSSRMMMNSGSDRSAMSSMSDRRFPEEPDYLSTDSAVNAALETLEREGDYDLDMSPREAMLRAVLHKRQQQRAQKRASSAGGGILKRSSSYFEQQPPPPPPGQPSLHAPYYH